MRLCNDKNKLKKFRTELIKAVKLFNYVVDC